MQPVNAQHSPPPEPPLYETITPGLRSFLTIIVMLGAFMAILDTTVVDVVVPKMMGPLATDLYGIQWVITAYMTAAAIGLLLTHNLSSVLGLKRLFLIGLIIFTLASALCGLAGSLTEMISSRVIQGFGESFIMASAQTILFSIYPPKKKGLAMGIYAMGVSFAPSLGPTVGGWITEHLSWRWVFFINMPVGLLNFVAGVFFLPNLVRHRQRLRFNFVSYLFIGAFTASLLILLSKGQQLGWSQSNLIVILSFAAGIFLLLYLLSELLSEHKLIDPAIFRNRVYTLSMGFYFTTMGLSIYLHVATLLRNLKNAHYLSNWPAHAGLCYLHCHGFAPRRHPQRPLRPAKSPGGKRCHLSLHQLFPDTLLKLLHAFSSGSGSDHPPRYIAGGLFCPRLCPSPRQVGR